ncbi:MAG: hypothetical protein V4543_15055 [Bacteroidota bacterium]
MKIAVIKTLVQNHTLPELAKAEEAILEEQALPFEVEGEDEGEQLTHVLAAIYVKTQIEHHGADANTALRDYTKRVRNSIS